MADDIRVENLKKKAQIKKTFQERLESVRCSNSHCLLKSDKKSPKTILGLETFRTSQESIKKQETIFSLKMNETLGASEFPNQQTDPNFNINFKTASIFDTTNI